MTLTDPATGARLWSSVLPDSDDSGPPVPGGLVVTGESVVAVSALGGVIPSAALPLQEMDGMTSLDYRTGEEAWSRSGDAGDPASLSLVAGGGGLVRTVNSHQDIEIYGTSGSVTAGTAAGPGDYTSATTASATTASVAAPGGADLIAGDEDGDVTAMDGRALAAGKDTVLWQAHLPGPAQQITHAQLAGRDALVAAATSAIGVLDARTGRLLRLIATPGTYAYTATVISAGGTPAVVVPGAGLTVYALATGARLWNYAAPSGAWFSDAAYADGVVAAEYSNAATVSHGATEMAAVGIEAKTGRLSWSQAADPSEVQAGDLWNGTYACPDIAGAGGDGVAFAWAALNGSGKVDVRNIVTGAPVYSDTSPNLSSLSQMLATSALGLIGISTQGGARLTPSGAVSSADLFGVSAALATDAAGDTALVTGDVSAQAYGTDVFTDSSATVAGSDTTYDTGQLVAGDFAGNGTRQVVAIPADWLAYQIVEAESGFLFPPDPLTVQHGLAMLTLTDSGTTAAPPSATNRPAASQERYPTAATPPGEATNTSAIPARMRPVARPGSLVPSPEPARSGVPQPDTSPATVRHTVSAAGTDSAPPGYSPAQMTAHLGPTGDGAGQTIAIVDAYDDPDIVSDTQAFSEQYGLPGVCGAGGAAGGCFNLDVREQSTSAGSDGDWAVETSLDVEWAHTIAPEATIELVEARDASFASLFQAVAAASADHPATVSMSWGISGEFTDETYYDHFCALTTAVCVVAAGDSGHSGAYPAYNPSVIAVGGTTQNLADDGSVTSEEAWSGSGSGQSWVEPEPAYQGTVQSSGSRQMPDVAFDADLDTGVALYDSIPYEGQQGWREVGGTSLGAPSWSAILADADQLRAIAGKAPLVAAGLAAQRDIYALPSTVIAPITTGPMNGYCPIGCTPGPGYDEITGLGSPRTGIDAALAKG